MRILQFVAVVLTALAFVPSGAHLFELPNKIGLPEQHYFLVQSIYRGWALFGVVIIAAIATNLLVAARLWHKVNRFGRASQLDLYWRLRCSSFSNGLTRPTRQPTTGLY